MYLENNFISIQKLFLKLCLFKFTRKWQFLSLSLETWEIDYNFWVRNQYNIKICTYCFHCLYWDQSFESYDPLHFSFSPVSKNIFCSHFGGNVFSISALSQACLMPFCDNLPPTAFFWVHFIHLAKLATWKTEWQLSAKMPN